MQVVRELPSLRSPRPVSQLLRCEYFRERGNADGESAAEWTPKGRSVAETASSLREFQVDALTKIPGLSLCPFMNT